jgi:ATP-dependent DNA helicase RecG
MFNKEAFREILLNAIVHKDYSSCNPIQISVYDDKIYIWNDGEMPSNLNSTDKLFMKHSSKPYNPKLANVFFKSGMIEAWGRGFEKIREACLLYNGPLPEYEINDEGIMVLCKGCDKYLELLAAKERVDTIILHETVETELSNESIKKILDYLKVNDEITTADGARLTGKSVAQVRRYLKVLCDLGIIKSNRTTKGNVYLKV